jgi:hypothetical protein
VTVATARITIVSVLRAAIALASIATLGCNGFGTGNSTQPGRTPNTSQQINFRMVGNIGTPFLATISNKRSSWKIRGVVPLNIIIVNGPNPNSVRIVASKLANDTRLLSVEAISGFDVLELSSTFTNYGIVVANIGGTISALAPAASPDVRFFARNAGNGIFNAVVEDRTTAFVLQSQSPTLILFDSPNSSGNPQSDRVDGIFNTVTGGPLALDLSFNGHVVSASGGGTVSIKVN